MNGLRGGCHTGARKHIRQKVRTEMSEKDSAKFGIKVNKMWGNQFSIGICISHWDDESYLYLNLFKWTVAIGFLYNYDKVIDSEE